MLNLTVNRAGWIIKSLVMSNEQLFTDGINV